MSKSTVEKEIRTMMRLRAGKKYKGCRLCKKDIWNHNCKKYKEVD